MWILDAESHKPYSRCREPGDQENLCRDQASPGGTPKCYAICTCPRNSRLTAGKATVKATVSTQDLKSVPPSEFEQAATADLTSQETCVLRFSESLLEEIKQAKRSKTSTRKEEERRKKKEERRKKKEERRKKKEERRKKKEERRKKKEEEEMKRVSAMVKEI
ncbi:hypothetical protein H920_09005 [Fukomys damarensis]|uniref:Uncharacterized protein n=1 Tax=Fukomys damarensis TaxID=885580 RepID=A0A091E3C8_FUKDA|nr:hypothetical protein H920_09005 [Fukomys damarensis]